MSGEYDGTHFLRSSCRLIDVTDLAAIDVARFKADYDLPDDLFAQPDHVAVKYPDIDSYRDALRHAQDYSTRHTEIEIQGRFLATVDLSRPIRFGSFGVMSLVEVMQRKRGSVDRAGFDHVEFAGDETALAAAREALQERGITFREQQNDSHQWISVVLPSGLEVKFNSSPLEQVIEDELARDKSQVIWREQPRRRTIM